MNLVDLNVTKMSDNTVIKMMSYTVTKMSQSNIIYIIYSDTDIFYS